MSEKGSLYLKSESLLGLYNKVNGYESTVQDALYDQYKIAYKISLTNYMRGDAADAFKNYFTSGTINMIQGLLDISSEMTMIIQLITEAFFQFESASDGMINETTINTIQTNLDSYKTTYNGMAEELNSVINLANEYISTTPLQFDDVNDSYDSVKTSNQSIKDDLDSIDDTALTNAEQLLTRIQTLKSLMTQTMGLCYKDGNFMPDAAKDLSKQSWYQKQTNATLSLMLAEDPFDYSAGEVSVSEDQWAAGLCSDVYAYGGYAFLNASYEAGVENQSVFVKAKANVLNINGYAQLTDYLRAKGELKVLYGSIDAKAGASDSYFGAHVTAEAGVLKVDGSAMLGNDNANLFVKGDAKLVCADGKAAFEFEDDGEFAVGVDASATLASASGKAGVSLFKYKVKDGSATAQKTDNLFKLDVKGGATVGGSFAAYADSKTAIETDYVNINATSLKLEVGLGLDLSVNVTIPTVYIKWPW